MVEDLHGVRVFEQLHYLYLVQHGLGFQVVEARDVDHLDHGEPVLLAVVHQEDLAERPRADLPNLLVFLVKLLHCLISPW